MYDIYNRLVYVYIIDFYHIPLKDIKFNMHKIFYNKS